MLFTVPNLIYIFFTYFIFNVSESANLYSNLYKAIYINLYKAIRKSSARKGEPWMEDDILRLAEKWDPREKSPSKTEYQQLPKQTKTQAPPPPFSELILLLDEWQ